MNLLLFFALFFLLLVTGIHFSIRRDQKLGNFKMFVSQKGILSYFASAIIFSYIVNNFSNLRYDTLSGEEKIITIAVVLLVSISIYGLYKSE